MNINSQKPVRWVASSRKDLCGFPEDVKDVMGQAILFAQKGKKHIAAKPMKGFTGAGVLEIVEDFDGDTYRAVYTIRFSDAVYVLHAFQKKSKKGIETPKTDIDLIKKRLKLVEDEYK